MDELHGRISQSTYKAALKDDDEAVGFVTLIKTEIPLATYHDV